MIRAALFAIAIAGSIWAAGTATEGIAKAAHDAVNAEDYR
jgi:hypothetical protein